MTVRPYAISLMTAALVFCVLLVGATRPKADELQADIEDFYGVYEGSTVADNKAGLSVRDLDVVIEPADDDGFRVTWTTTKYSAQLSPKHKTYTIEFNRTARDGVYSSAMRRDMFGNQIPLDPFKGEPFVWAALRGSTLTVYALLITEDAGYELQTYDRTLTDTGLHLEFSRIREGLHLKYITGDLKRTDG